MNAIVRIRGISKRFPVRRGWIDTMLHPRSSEYESALQAIDLDVPEGEIFGLLGQNGAGKSTLFKILATLILPDTGTAEVGGFDTVRDASRVRNILTPVIPNERSLYWRLSARENLRLYAALQGVSRANEGRALDEILSVVGLGDAGDKQVGMFSSGMRQRLLVARALLGRPQVLLLDEPTRSMDPVGARDFRSFIRTEVNGARGCTVLLATHDHQEVDELCTRVGVLDRGRLLAVGAIEDLATDLRVHRYRLWTRTPDHPSILAMESEWRAQRLVVEAAPVDGWVRIGFELAEGADSAARLLGHLTASGVVLSRFERVDLPLAELIERVSERDGNGGAG